MVKGKIPKMPRTIQIVPVLNGFLVNAGCQSIVVKNVGELASEIARYYSNPRQTELEYIKNAVNQTLVDTPATLNRPILRASVDECAKMPEPAQECCEPTMATEPRRR